LKTRNTSRLKRIVESFFFLVEVLVM
jgi:hypothetical protein